MLELWMTTGLSTWDLKVHGKTAWLLSFLHIFFKIDGGFLRLTGFITSYFRISCTFRQCSSESSNLVSQAADFFLDLRCPYAVS